MRVWGFLLILLLLLIAGCSEAFQPDPLPPFTVYGELEDFQGDNASVVFEIKPKFVNWRPNQTTLVIKIENLTRQEISYLPDLENGKEYAFYFFTGYEHQEVFERWRITKISENFTEYQLDGREYLKNDLIVDPLEKSEAGRPCPEDDEACSELRKVIYTYIKLGEPNEVQVLLKNDQDYDITYDLIDVKLIYEVAYPRWEDEHWYENVPPYNERFRNAIIDECEIEFDASEHVMKRDTRKNLLFNVTCPIGANVTKIYEYCDSPRFRLNCSNRTVDYNTEMFTDFQLNVAYEFVDGIGNIHTRSRFKDHLRIKHD